MLNRHLRLAVWLPFLAITLVGCITSEKDPEWLTRAPLSCTSIAIIRATNVDSGNAKRVELRVEIKNHTDRCVAIDLDFIKYIHYSLKYTDAASVEWRIQPPCSRENIGESRGANNFCLIAPGATAQFTNSIATSASVFKLANAELIAPQKQVNPQLPVRFSGMYSALVRQVGSTKSTFYYIYSYGYIH